MCVAVENDYAFICFVSFGPGAVAPKVYAPSLQATRAETRLTVYRAHASLFLGKNVPMAQDFFLTPKNVEFSSIFEVSQNRSRSFQKGPGLLIK